MFIFVTDNSKYIIPNWKEKKKTHNCSYILSSPFITKLINFKIIPFRYFEELKRKNLTSFPYISSLSFCYLNILLGSTNPERNALLQEPLSTSVENYNCSQFSNCYYHQDLHQWSFQFDSHQIFVNFCTSPSRLSTWKFAFFFNFQFGISYYFVRFSAMNFQSFVSRLVSYYAFLGWFLLPWPQSNCLWNKTSFLVSRLANTLAL